MKDLTPDVGPHSHGIANWGQSTCRTDARPIARSNDDLDGLGRGLEHLAAVPDPADQLATSLATSTQIVTTADFPSPVCWLGLRYGLILGGIVEQRIQRGHEGHSSPGP